jgi:DHA2 family multidrug resistance protein-like MFS transporter
LILAGLISLSFTGLESSTLTLGARFVVLGIGFGLFQAPNLNEVLSGVSPSLTGLAASTNAVLKNLGSLLGITLMVMVFAWFSQVHLALGEGNVIGIAAYKKAFALAALVAAINLVANLLPRRP